MANKVVELVSLFLKGQAVNISVSYSDKKTWKMKETA